MCQHFGFHTACDAIREGLWNASTIAADRQQSNLKEPSGRGIAHRPHSRYDPSVVQEEIESLGCKPVRLGAWSDPCAPISPAELKSVPVCSGGALVEELELVRGAGRGSQIQFNPAHFHQCAVLPHVVLWCGVVCCIAAQCSAVAAASEAAEAAGTANGCLACRARPQRRSLNEATKATEATETGDT